MARSAIADKLIQINDEVLVAAEAPPGIEGVVNSFR
jgi:hypothetical protein